MTDLFVTIPDFPIKPYTHLLPSLEKHLITTSDLLTLDAPEIAKRAQLPLFDVRRLADHVVSILQRQLGLGVIPDADDQQQAGECLRKSGREITSQWSTISSLDDSLDRALGGGIPTGYLTEVVGERYFSVNNTLHYQVHRSLLFHLMLSGAGKTQFLLNLLLSAQLPPPHGLGRPTLYISTEHALPTNRLSQILRNKPILSKIPQAASLSQILTLQTPDLESQEHILTNQLPIALVRHNIGLCIIDSIAANYREEGHSSASALAHRSTLLVRLGTLLRSLARIHNCAFVVSNQVADRFPPTNGLNHHLSAQPLPSSAQETKSAYQRSLITLEHQQRFFTGWGAHPLSSSLNLKTPSLGLVWANQIACRIALIKEPQYGAPRKQGPTCERNGIGEEVPANKSGTENKEEEGGESVEWSPMHWRRWMMVVFAPWVRATGESEKGVEFEIWAGGIRVVQPDAAEDANPTLR